MANVMFKKGLLANLPASYAEGTFYVTTDERAIYLDVDNSTRIRIGDFQEFATLEALQANSNPSTSALYYISGLNVLAKWNGTDYVQINLDTGATSFEVVGEGNAITSVSYNATTRKLTLTKGETFATKAELNALDARVGAIPEGYTEETIVAYINKKAEETLNAASGGSSESAASVLAALNTYKAENDPKVTDLQTRMTAAEGEIDALQAIDHEAYIAADEQVLADAKEYAEEQAGAVDTKLTEEVTRAKAAEEANAAAAKAADDKAVAAQEDVDALAEKVGEVPADKTVVQMISDAQAAATYDDTQVKADIAANAEAIQVEKERMDAFMTLEDGQTLNAALDSLKEIQDFITNEAADADILLGKVSDLEAIVAGIGGEGESATVVAYVTAAIEALKIGDYAKAADLTALADRVAAMEAKVPNWDAAEQNAKDYADGLNTAMDTRVKTLEEIDHDAYVAADEQVLSEAKEYADQAEADALAAAKEYANGLDAAMDARVDVLEAIDHNAYVAADATNLQAAKDYADGLAGNYDASGSASAAEAAAKAYTDAALTWGSF
jgi:hypothetical protein